MVGVEADYRLVASGPVPLLTVPGVLAGQTAELVMQAVNRSLQGVASEPILFTVPPMRVRSESAAPTPGAEEAPVVKGFTNLSENGNGHGARARA